METRKFLVSLGMPYCDVGHSFMDNFGPKDELKLEQKQSKAVKMTWKNGELGRW